MTAKTLPMRKIREILRSKHEVGLSHRAIARACSVGVGAVSLYVARARKAGLVWPLPEELDEAALETRLLRRPRSPTGPIALALALIGLLRIWGSEWDD